MSSFLFDPDRSNPLYEDKRLDRGFESGYGCRTSASSSGYSSSGEEDQIRLERLALSHLTTFYYKRSANIPSPIYSKYEDKTDAGNVQIMKERFYKNKIERFRERRGWSCEFSDCDDETSLKDSSLIEFISFLIHCKEEF